MVDYNSELDKHKENTLKDLFEPKVAYPRKDIELTKSLERWSFKKDDSYKFQNLVERLKQTPDEKINQLDICSALCAKGANVRQAYIVLGAYGVRKLNGSPVPSLDSLGYSQEEAEIVSEKILSNS